MYCIFRSDEGEIRNDAYTLYGYLQLPDLNFASFTGMILAMSRAHSASDREAVSGLWLNSSKNLGAVCRDFLTGSPNYCYPLGKTLEYREVEIGSSVSVTAAGSATPAFIRKRTTARLSTYVRFADIPKSINTPSRKDGCTTPTCTGMRRPAYMKRLKTDRTDVPMAASDTKKTGSSQKNNNRPFEPAGFICIFC